MSDFTYVNGFVIPAGYGASPVFVSKTPLGPCTVEEIMIEFPPGCAGLVGAQIQAGGGAAYPNNPGAFFVFDDYNMIQEVDNQINTGDWAIATFNNDSIPHIIRVIYKCNYLIYTKSSSVSSPVSL